MFVTKYSKTVTVHLSGTFETSLGTKMESPILISLNWGKGLIVYTSFHNHAQTDDKQKLLLTYLVLKMLSTAAKVPVLELANQKGILRRA